MASPTQTLLRKLPSVEFLLQHGKFEDSTQEVPRHVIVDALRMAVDETRQRMLAGDIPDVDEATVRDQIMELASARIRSASGPHYRKVVNATGIILHTGLGRAVLPSQAIRQIQEHLSGYSLLQADPVTGKRSKRDGRIEWLLQQLTGAEAATVVNNNAAATAIVLNTVGKGKEVIVSRGQLVEIGGSFRLPEVMEASGATLVEVGTTNKTHPRDYERAVTENTAAIMRVHPSNYKISGFTSEVPLETLVQIAHAHGLVMIDDVGAGPLINFARFGFEPEPILPDSVKAGADLITSSADKLIGACQGGIILGRTDLIQAIRKNPWARIVRVGKSTLAALEATLTLFLEECVALDQVPTLRMLRRELGSLEAQAHRIASAVHQRLPEENVAVIDGFSQMGSGSLPTQNLPTRLVAVAPTRSSPDELATRLRQRATPVVCRIHKGQVLLDPRTILDGEEELVIQALVEVLEAAG